MTDIKSRLERETVEDRDSCRIDELEDLLETKPEKKNLGIALAHFFIPWIVGISEILLLYTFLDYGTFSKLGFWMLVYFLPPAGKESVIPLAIGTSELDPLLIALTIASIDIIVGLFLIWNFDIAKKIPLFGRLIIKLEQKGGKILADNKYIQALSFIGITLFVMVPFQGSGAVGASIVGRMIGLNPYKVWVAIIVGAITGCLMLAFASSTFKRIFIDNWLAGAVMALTVVAIVAIYLVKKRNNLAEKCKEINKEEVDGEKLDKPEDGNNETEE